MGRGSAAAGYDEDIVPPVMRKTIAVYEAAKALMGYITPGYDEVSQVCGLPTPCMQPNSSLFREMERRHTLEDHISL